MIFRFDTQPLVKDLTPADLQPRPEPQKRTAIEIARSICTKIGNNRPGDLFADPTPAKEDHGIQP